MRFQVYGDAGAPAVMLIHGGGAAPWMYADAAELLKDRYRVILPVLDGHGGEKTTFLSSRDSGAGLAAYVAETLGGRLALVGGGSLGAQTALEVLANPGIRVRAAILESGIYYPKPAMAELTAFPPLIRYSMRLLNRPQLLEKSYRATGWDPKFYAAYVEAAKALSFESSRNLYRSYFRYAPPGNLAAVEARVAVVYGSREKPMIVKDAARLTAGLKHSRLMAQAGCGHCEFGINHSGEFAALVASLLSD
jgi:pimeloyl-ACP methyl ester carboxylesterase